MKTAPLMVLDNSVQAVDVKGSKAPSDIIKGTYRIKTYNKADHWRRMFDEGTGVRSLLFDQPFQVATEVTGLDWNVTNRVFMGQLAACNLRCDYCYVDQNGFLGEGRVPQVVEVSSEQYVDDFVEHILSTHKRTGKIDAGVLRYSGGEPFLFQEWLTDSLMYLANDVDMYILDTGPEPGMSADVINIYSWVDTNLTISPTEGLLDVLATPYVGLCGCFKPDQCDIDLQLMVVNELVKGGVDVYLYFPSNGSEVDLRLVLDGLSEIHPNLPLRLNVIEIRWGYSAMQDRREMVSRDQSEADYVERRRIYGQYVSQFCDETLLHLPSHQVPIS